MSIHKVEARLAVKVAWGLCHDMPPSFGPTAGYRGKLPDGSTVVTYDTGSWGRNSATLQPPLAT